MDAWFASNGDAEHWATDAKRTGPEVPHCLVFASLCAPGSHRLHTGISGCAAKASLIRDAIRLYLQKRAIQLKPTALLLICCSLGHLGRRSALFSSRKKRLHSTVPYDRMQIVCSDLSKSYKNEVVNLQTVCKQCRSHSLWTKNPTRCHNDLIHRHDKTKLYELILLAAACVASCVRCKNFL